MTDIFNRARRSIVLGAGFLAGYIANTSAAARSEATNDPTSEFPNQDASGALSGAQSPARGATTNALDYLSDAQRGDVLSNVGSLGVATSIQTAIDTARGLVRLAAGTWKIDRQIVIRGNCTGLVGDGMYLTILKKAFNGDCISSHASGAHISDLDVEGHGAAYAGGGIVPLGYNTVIERVRINGTKDSPIVFNAAVGTNLGSGTYSHINDCFLLPLEPRTTFAARSNGADESIRPTCRSFSNISGGGALVDFSGMNYAVLRDSLGTNVKFDSNSAKIVMQGNRITATAGGKDITIYGKDHVISANLWTFAAGKTVIIDSTCTNILFSDSNPISSGSSYLGSPAITADVGDPYPNNVSTQLKAYNAGWHGSTSNPVLGNAVVAAFYRLDGRLCHVNLRIVVGTTTNVGAGTYAFDLPFKAQVASLGNALLKTSHGTAFACTAEVGDGSNHALIWRSGDSTSFASTTMAIGAGAVIELAMTYLVSPT